METGSPSTGGQAVVDPDHQVDAAVTDLAAEKPGDIGDHLVDAEDDSLRGTLADEIADPANDLAGPHGLFADLFERKQQDADVGNAGIEPARRPVGIVGDRRQRLIQFMGEAGRHFAHGAETGHMGNLVAQVQFPLLGGDPLGNVEHDPAQPDDIAVPNHRNRPQKNGKTLAVRSPRQKFAGPHGVAGQLATDVLPQTVVIALGEQVQQRQSPVQGILGQPENLKGGVIGVGEPALRIDLENSFRKEFGKIPEPRLALPQGPVPLFQFADKPLAVDQTVLKCAHGPEKIAEFVAAVGIRHLDIEVAGRQTPQPGRHLGQGAGNRPAEQDRSGQHQPEHQHPDTANDPGEAQKGRLNVIDIDSGADDPMPAIECHDIRELRHQNVGFRPRPKIGDEALPLAFRHIDNGGQRPPPPPPPRRAGDCPSRRNSRPRIGGNRDA